MPLAVCPVVPMPGYLVVMPLESEGRSKGGIILPDNAKEKPTRGTVEAISFVPKEAARADAVGSVERCLPVDEGDVVIYGKYAGSEIDVDGEKFVVLSAKDVIAKIGG